MKIPREEAEALTTKLCIQSGFGYARPLSSFPEILREVEAAFAARDDLIKHALLEEDEALIEAMARGICSDEMHSRNSPDHRRTDKQKEDFVDWHWKAHKWEATAALTALRRHRGVE